MKRYSVARARAKLAQVLDQAEQGESVVIERRGVRFAVKPIKSKPATKAPRIEIIDPAVGAGQWSWSWTQSGLDFAAGGKASRKRRT